MGKSEAILHLTGILMDYESQLGFCTGKDARAAYTRRQLHCGHWQGQKVKKGSKRRKKVRPTRARTPNQWSLLKVL